MILQGKGFYLWRIDRVDQDPNVIADTAKQAGLTHVLVKVADGRYTYNVDKESEYDYVPPVIEAIKSRGIQAWGWHYVYGHYPEIEARFAIRRAQQLELDGYVVNAEDPYRKSGMDAPARTFMLQLRKALPNTPIGLSTYRYPSLHRPFPFETFLEYCDINMPQVYWLKSHDPQAQLLKSLRDYQNINPWRPYFPTGAAYGEHGWRAKPDEVQWFLEGVRKYDLPGCNFWEWSFAHQDNRALWNPVANFDWPVEERLGDVSMKYFDALNSGDPAKVSALYNQQGVHVTARRTLQGRDSILGWYNEMLKQKLPNARFQVTGSSQRDNMRTLTWTADSSAGQVLDGKDSIGVKDNKIAYHYSYFTVHPN